MMKNLNIGQKVLVSYILVILIFIGLGTYIIVRLNTLGNLQDEGARRAEHSVKTSRYAELGQVSYRIIADAIINRDEKVSKYEWNERKGKIELIMAELDAIVDTPDEKTWLSEAKQNYKQIENIVDTQLFPLIFGTDQLSGQVMEQIKGTDADIDKLLSMVQVSIDKITHSIEQESLEGDERFDQISKATISLVIIIISIFNNWLSYIFILFKPKY
ncbi:MAG: hypothetical protein HC905_25555 [Bacteroidales bacterium]|nr:hypothetical protein [Bacteroidales bacterium]